MKTENQTQEPIHIISLGAGVQSSTMALMAAKGEITPMPKAAIFADVGAEPKAVYDYINYIECFLPFPVIRVKENDGLTHAIERGALLKKRAANPPLFTLNQNNGSKGVLTRDCTSEFKIKPIIAECRKWAGLKPRQQCKTVKIVQWIGISLEETIRMKDSRTPWIEHRWPLIESKMSRHDCLRWIKKHHFAIPPRSACVYCPYHSNDEWRKIKSVESEWLEAVRIDELIRNGIRGTKDQLFVHKSCTPLRDVDFSTEEERGQINMFNNECEGMCGV